MSTHQGQVWPEVIMNNPPLAKAQADPCATQRVFPPNTPPPSPAAIDELAIPACFGRYRVTKEVGHGGYGVVYRGYDEELRREVAIKVPHRERLAFPDAT